MSSGLSIGQKGRRHHYLWWVVGFFGIVSLAVIGWYTYQWYTTGMQPPIPIPVARADSRVDESDVSQDEIDSHNVLKNNPKYISIPELDISKTRIYSVGVDNHNLLEMPTNINDAGWYKKSMIPGTGYGAVLIDGHNGGNRTNGVFAKLNKLKEGDKITIERGDGQEYNYKVVENQTMSLEKVASSGMKMMMESADPEKEGLNLMTDAGTWIPRTNQFDQRIMLRAIAAE
jgi:LPXTG-site transpeptidase (sortase) family protein